MAYDNVPLHALQVGYVVVFTHHLETSLYDCPSIVLLRHRFTTLAEACKFIKIGDWSHHISGYLQFL